jgi:hypothetical protein
VNGTVDRLLLPREECFDLFVGLVKRAGAAVFLLAAEKLGDAAFQFAAEALIDVP